MYNSNRNNKKLIRMRMKIKMKKKQQILKQDIIRINDDSDKNDDGTNKLIISKLLKLYNIVDNTNADQINNLVSFIFDLQKLISLGDGVDNLDKIKKEIAKMENVDDHRLINFTNHVAQFIKENENDRYNKYKYKQDDKDNKCIISRPTKLDCGFKFQTPYNSPGTSPTILPSYSNQDDNHTKRRNSLTSLPNIKEINEKDLESLVIQDELFFPI